jgi:hypothetical protein
MKRFSVLALLCLCPAVTLAQSALQFRDMFNGKDLTGWVNINTAPET